MRDPNGGTGLSFQEEADYEPPVWPEQGGKPAKMLHLDFLVDDLDTASAHAVACGAVISPLQFFNGVRTFFDPAGHPFCLFVDTILDNYNIYWYYNDASATCRTILWQYN
jgi:hypothetical protein